jgi:general secretion pathway protein A
VGPDARRALVVDDDPKAREVLRDFLRLCGLSVLEARNGLEALLSVKRHEPRAVVLDLNMPRLGGFETLKHIRRFDPTIRVAVVTENLDAAIHEQARALGATVVLSKPVDLAQLGTALDLTPGDPPRIAPGSPAASRWPAAPAQPSAPRIRAAGDEAWRQDYEGDFATATSLDAGLEPRTALGVNGADGERGGDLEAPRAEDEGELGRLTNAVRAFLGGGPAPASASGRWQENVDETIPGKRTMSYYGILGLRQEPFSTSPDPAFFYESASHKAVLYRLQIAIKLKRGLSLVLGDVGMGKTTLSRRLLQLLKREEKVSSHLILNPAYETEVEFLTALVKLFGITPPAGTLPVARYLEILEGYLFERGVEEDRTVVLLIDEAQRLSSSSLELLRALLNYETNEYKLLQLILMGQMELLPRIREMKNLWDRISLKCVIDPLDQADTEALIAFRLRTAGYTARRNLFTADAIQEIYRHSRGSPRRITTLCHDALERLVVSDKHEVDADIIRGLMKQVLT